MHFQIQLCNLLIQLNSEVVVFFLFIFFLFFLFSLHNMDNLNKEKRLNIFTFCIIFIITNISTISVLLLVIGMNWQNKPEQSLCFLTVGQCQCLSDEYWQRHPKTLHTVTSCAIKDLWHLKCSTANLSSEIKTITELVKFHMNTLNNTVIMIINLVYTNWMHFTTFSFLC